MRLVSRFVSIALSTGFLISLFPQPTSCLVDGDTAEVPSGLNLVLGRWTVVGKMGDPAKPTTVTNEEDCVWAPGHTAVVCDIQTSGEFGHSHGMSVHTFDRKTSQYMYRAVNSTGSSEAASGTSSGPDDITWNGKLSMRDFEMTTRLTIHRVSPGEETVTLERGSADGSFAPMMQGKRTRKQ